MVADKVNSDHEYSRSAGINAVAGSSDCQIADRQIIGTTNRHLSFDHRVAITVNCDSVSTDQQVFSANTCDIDIYGRCRSSTCVNSPLQGIAIVTVDQPRAGKRWTCNKEQNSCRQEWRFEKSGFHRLLPFAL